MPPYYPINVTGKYSTISTVRSTKLLISVFNIYCSKSLIPFRYHNGVVEHYSSRAQVST